MEQIQFKVVSEGVLIPVRVTPQAKHVVVGGVHDGCLKISVTAVPDKGKANDAVVDALADFLSVAKSQISIVAGLTARRKQVLVRCDDTTELLNRVWPGA